MNKTDMWTIESKYIDSIKSFSVTLKRNGVSYLHETGTPLETAKSNILTRLKGISDAGVVARNAMDCLINKGEL